jgi:hypothetical protein
MSISMNTTQSRHMSKGRSGSRGEITSRLAKACEGLSLVFSAIGAKRLAEQDLKNHETPRCEISYEARKRELLIAVRQKISEKQTKID